MNSEITQYKNWMPILICLALAVLTIAAYSSIRDSGFVNFDDNLFASQNAYVQSGLNWNSIGKAFSFELAKQSGWVPLTWLSLMLDTQIFGVNASGYHLTNLLFHMLNTILLFLVLHRMTRTLWPSAFVAALFAIHPLHVESVAWIAERRDVLSAFFMMLTLGAYSYYVEQRNLTRYAFVLLFFILSLMAKPMLVTLPFVLLLLDYWPLGRLSEAGPVQKIQAEVLKPGVFGKPKKKAGKKVNAKEIPEVEKPVEPGIPAGAKYKWSLIYPLLIEKIPLFVVAILLSIVTFAAAQSEGFITEAIPLGARIGNAFISYVAYMGKMIWPVNLAVFYPYPEKVIPWQVFGSILLLIGITLAVLWRAKRSPYLATGWLWYVGTLVPVIGIVQLGAQAMADRYTYVPLIGLFIMVAWGIPELLKKVNYRKEMLWTASVFCLLCLSILTWIQVGHWRSGFTLFDHTLKVTDNNWLAYDGRCAANNEIGNHRQALDDCDRALRIKPRYVTAYNSRGIACSALGNYRQAIEDYGRAIEIRPDYADAYYNRGAAYMGIGDYAKAIENYGRAVKINPGHADAYNNMGIAYAGLGDYGKAIENYDRAVKINPSHADAYNNMGIACFRLGNYQQAIASYGKAIETRTGYKEAYFNRSVVYIKTGHKNMAVNDLVVAAKLGDERARNLLKLNGIRW